MAAVYKRARAERDLVTPAPMRFDKLLGSGPVPAAAHLEPTRKKSRIGSVFPQPIQTADCADDSQGNRSFFH